MTDNIKLPPMPQTIENRLSDFAVACAFGQHELRASAARELRQAIEEHVREAVRLNAQTVPDGWKLVPVQATPGMCKAAVIYANGNAVYKNVAHEALEIEESIYSEVYAAMLSAAPAAQPLTDEQIADDYFGRSEGAVSEHNRLPVNGSLDCFRAGVRFAERKHRIGVKP